MRKIYLLIFIGFMFAGIANAQDLTAPSITYTSLTNTVCTGNRTVSTAITDASDINTTIGSRPRIYFKKSTNTNGLGATNDNTTDGWKYTEATNTVSPFNISINTGLISGGVSAGDIIQYFVVAEDLATTPNVGINNGTFAATPLGVALTSAAFPVGDAINSYTINTGLSGTVTVGPGADTYSSLTAAGGLFAAINASGLAGNLTATITGNINSEDGINALNAISYGCAGPYTLTIKTTGVYTISGSNTGGLIRLNGADNVVIDGSIGSTANTVCPASAASRDLTITNTDAGTGSAVIWLQTAADGAANNTVKNCVITGNSNTTTLVGIGTGGATVGNGAGANGNNNNSFINNAIAKVTIGVFTSGSGAGNKNNGNIINQNVMTTAAPDNIGRAGVIALYENNITVSGNAISGIIYNGSADVIGIGIGVSASVTTSTLDGGESTNATITNNVIGTIQQTNTYSAIGIGIQAATSGTTLIANNMLSGVNSNGTSPDFAAGILLGGGAGSVTNVYHNSVTMTGTFAGGDQPSFAVAIHDNNPVVNLRNNIFTSTGNTGANLNRAIGLNYNSFTNLTSNNNDLYASGTGSAVGQTVNLTDAGATSQTTLANWQTASGKDGSSKNILPGFVSATNLHLLTPDTDNYNNLESAGAAVAVAADIDCETRPNGVAADIGADEFAGAIPSCIVPTTVTAGSIATTSASISFVCTTCTGTYIVEYGITGFTPGTGAVAGVGGTIATGASSPIAISPLLAATTYEVYVRQVCSGPSYSLNSAVTTFTTLCNSFTIPYTENFDGVAAPALPVCTSKEDVNGATTWNTATDNPRSGVNALTYNYDNALAGDDWFFTGQLSLTGGTSYRLTFFYRANSASFPEALEVKYGTTATAAAMSGGSLLFSNTSITATTYQQAVVDFTPVATGTYYIGFHAISLADQFDLYIDDISVDLTPACAPPLSLSLLATGTNTASVSFTSPGNNFIVEYGAPGFTPGIADLPGAGGTITTGTASPISITGLTGGPLYDIYVRQVCAGPSYSSNSVVALFIKNDDAPGAITLTVNAGITSATETNVAATKSTNEVYPSCSGSAIAPVWYKFTAPASGAVRITLDTVTAAGTFTDSKVALFSATDVADYSTFTILSCDDDGGSSIGFEFMSVLYYAGLTPGTVYYIAVDKYSLGDPNGTFGIAVDELNGSMLAAANTCSDSYQTPLGSNAYTGWVPLMNDNSKLIALVQNPAGGATSRVNAYTVAQNINTLAVRTDPASGQKYLDRSFRIINDEAVSNINVQFFFRNTELSALQATDPAVTLANMGITRQEETVAGCHADFLATNGTNTHLTQTSSGSVNGVSWIRTTTPAFSNFYLHITSSPLVVKTYLQGAYNSGFGRHKDVNSTWAAVLNANALTQPYNTAAFGNYNGGETVTNGFFTSNGTHARDVLDWVLLEVKNSSNVLVARRAAFVREDGKIIDTNGDTLVTFNGLGSGNFYLTIRHRNHLGMSVQNLLPVTAKTLGIPLPTSTYDFDFTSATETSIFGDALAYKIVGGNNVMICGNANSNGNVRYGGGGNDPGSILLYLGSSPLTILNNVYSSNDVNLDGTVRYGGGGNDPGFLLLNSLSSSPLLIVSEQKR